MRVTSTSDQPSGRNTEGRSASHISAVFAGALFLAATALVNRQLAKNAEEDNSPAGSFLEIDGVRLHYLEKGAGDTVVLLHGNGSMIEDFEASGLLQLVSQRYRVIAIDRPGFGHTNRPTGVTWSPENQAELIHRALLKLGVADAVVLGHSWGASVAIALALSFPGAVRALVLASGYYYPSVRPDVLLLSAPAMPLIGRVLSHTISPILSRLLWPLLTRRIFAPAPVPTKFSEFPKEMAVRPSQIHASASEAAMMIPDAILFRRRYSELKMPVVIIAGEGDRLADIDSQSAQLHRQIRQSTFRRIPGAGHMVHQTAPDLVMVAIDEAAAGRLDAN